MCVSRLPVSENVCSQISNIYVLNNFIAQVFGMNVIETGAKISTAPYSAQKPVAYSDQLHFILKVRVVCAYLPGLPRSKNPTLSCPHSPLVLKVRKNAVYNNSGKHFLPIFNDMSI